jgi:hypothetical protein
VDNVTRMCKRLGGDPATVSDFQRTKSKFRLDSRRDSSRLEVYYIEKGLDFRSNWIRMAETHFQPFISRTSNSQHLLVIDGHSSCVMARFIAYCITSKIDLFLLPPHSSYRTQPLDLSIFGPLKTALNLEVDRIFRHSTMQLLRVEWTSAYIDQSQGPML